MENGEENMDENQLRQRKIISSAKQKLGSASKLLRKKIPCTGHLMTPRKLWIQMVPTRECDVVLMFPSSTSNTILMWLLTRLKNGAPGLAVHLRHHSSSDSYGFYLTAPYKVLLKAAEQYNLPKLLKKTYGGGLKEFTEKDLLCFEGTENKNNFFTTQERQWLVLKVLHNLRANESDVKEKPAGVHLNEGQAIVPKFLTAGVISQVFPLHELPCLEKLQKSWVQAFFEKQPLDDICDYFGVKIAMYFAWLGHYTMALIVPAIVGFLFWIGFCRGDQATEDVLYVLFSLFNVIWTSIYLEAWKRCSATLAYKWGTLDQRNDLLVEPRPFFTGPLEVSPVTNRLEPTYPSWKRYVFRYFVTVPIMVVCLAVVFITMIIILQVQDWWDAVLQRRGFPFFLSYFPKILLAIVITFFDEAYYKVARWLNDMENYRIDADYENNLIVKVALDQEKLKEQLAALLITRQVIGNIKESALPYLLEQIRLAKLSFDLFGALSPSDAKKFPGQQTEEDESQVEDGSSVDSKTDSVKSPNNRSIGQAELESTLFKNAMEVMGLIAVLVNCALIGLSGQVQRMFPEMSTTQTILLIVALEHIMLILHYLISYSIPDLPEWVATEIAKVEFARRQAECPCSTTAQENNGLEIGRLPVWGSIATLLSAGIACWWGCSSGSGGKVALHYLVTAFPE
ncbi:hypothetical protein RUM43_005032 [Polyplax serrata]|uniref:Anoctamin n=1 Tax=Polyplax serrata TaxID=468196 RepID=A0AAN8SDT3_POLSC